MTPFKVRTAQFYLRTDGNILDDTQAVVQEYMPGVPPARSLSEANAIILAVFAAIEFTATRQALLFAKAFSITEDDELGIFKDAVDEIDDKG